MRRPGRPRDRHNCEEFHAKGFRSSRPRVRSVTAEALAGRMDLAGAPVVTKLRLLSAVRVSLGLALEDPCFFGSSFPAVQGGFEGRVVWR